MIRFARTLGLVAQAVIVGALLFLAVVELLAERSGATIFVYQRF